MLMNRAEKENNSVKLPEEIHTTPGGQKPANFKNDAKNVIPDEVPRKGQAEKENKRASVRQKCIEKANL